MPYDEGIERLTRLKIYEKILDAIIWGLLALLLISIGVGIVVAVHKDYIDILKHGVFKLVVIEVVPIGLGQLCCIGVAFCIDDIRRLKRQLVVDQLFKNNDNEKSI